MCKKHHISSQCIREYLHYEEQQCLCWFKASNYLYEHWQKKKGKDMLLYLHLDTRAIKMKCNSSISLRAQDIVAGANNDLSYFGVKINYKYICIYYS